MIKIIEYDEYNGSDNMRIDKNLLESAIKEHANSAILRLYGWKPKCVSLGKNQSEENVNKLYCQTNGIDIVKRPTGGRGLLHDDELTYAFICPISMLKNGESIINSYKEISNALIEGFKNINIKLTIGGEKVKTSFDYCMSLSTGADLNYNGKKLIGSAQYRTQGYILQHGSILFSYDKDTIEKIFNEKVNTQSLTCIKEINQSLTRADTAEAVKQGFKSLF